jgi:hypothetical protein
LILKPKVFYINYLSPKLPLIFISLLSLSNPL